jgi:hypothetical protein
MYIDPPFLVINKVDGYFKFILFLEFKLISELIFRLSHNLYIGYLSLAESSI